MTEIKNGLHKCSHCKQWKNISVFGKHKTAPCGLAYWCYECCNTSHNRGYALNPTRYLARTMRYYFNNRERLSEITRLRDRKYKQTIMSWYGGQCRCCGESGVDFLTIDHINDDGIEQRRKSNCWGGSHLYRNILKSGCKDKPQDLQILCANCQMGKVIGKGFCMHHPNVDLRVPLESEIWQNKSFLELPVMSGVQ